MADEIERRFLVHPSRAEEAIRNSIAALHLAQGYLGFQRNTIRLQHAPGQAGILTILGSARRYRVDIPDADAQAIAARDLKDPEGFINADAMTVRVRIENAQRGILTLKGRSKGISCSEYEYELPLDDARELLKLDALYVIHKVRHKVPFEGHLFEVDCFKNALDGRLIAEVELASEDEALVIPPWCGPEISGMFEFSNLSLGKLTAADMPALYRKIAELFAAHGRQA